jgi:hypothetical protein
MKEADMHATTLNPSSAAFARRTPGFWRRVWTALEAHGQRRAEAELRRIAMLHVSTDPVLSQQLREIAVRMGGR